MRLLLDTHTFVWAVDASSNHRLSPRARSAIEVRENDVFVSAASAWEIASKYRIGRWPEAGRVLSEWNTIITELGAAELPITAKHALRAGGYPVEHADPFDRMLAAQAELDGLSLVSVDRSLQAFAVDLLW